jgi:uncharacterized membrane protein
VVLHQPLIDRIDGRRRPVFTDREVARPNTLTRVPTLVASRDRVQVSHVSLWSVLRAASVFWVAAAAAIFGFLFVAWTIASATGAISSLEALVADMLGADTVSIRAAHVLGAAGFVAVLFAALATIVTMVAAAVYNLGAHVMGGIELELDER